MFDTEYNSQVRAMIESIEPDMTYQGSEGLLDIAIESTQNMMMMDAFIESGMAFLEEGEERKFETDYETKKEKKGLFGSLVDFVKKIFSKLKAIILKVISKLKGLFVSVMNKLKTWYAAAVKKIGETMKNNSSFKDTNLAIEEVSWFKMVKEIPFDYHAGLQPCYVLKDEFDKMKTASDDLLDTTENKEDERAEVDTKQIIAAMAHATKEDLEDGIKEYLKKHCFEEVESKPLSKSDFDLIYKKNIISNLNQTYKDAMKHQTGLKTELDKMEKAAIKDAKEKADKKRIHRVAKICNKNITVQTNAVIKYMSAALSTLIFGFHQALKASAIALKGTAAAKLRSGKDWVANKIGADESFDFTIV